MGLHSSRIKIILTYISLTSSDSMVRTSNINMINKNLFGINKFFYRRERFLRKYGQIFTFYFTDSLPASFHKSFYSFDIS